MALGAQPAEVVWVVRVAFDLDHHTVDAVNQYPAPIAAHLADTWHPDIVAGRHCLAWRRGRGRGYLLVAGNQVRQLLLLFA